MGNRKNPAKAVQKIIKRIIKPLQKRLKMKNRVDKTPERSYALQCLRVHAEKIIKLIEDIRNESAKKKSYKIDNIEEIKKRLKYTYQFCDLFIKGEFTNDKEEQQTG